MFDLDVWFTNFEIVTLNQNHSCETTFLWQYKHNFQTYSAQSFKYCQSIEQLFYFEMERKNFSPGIAHQYFFWTNNFLQSPLSWMPKRIARIYAPDRNAGCRFF